MYNDYYSYPCYNCVNAAMCYGGGTNNAYRSNPCSYYYPPAFGGQPIMTDYYRLDKGGDDQIALRDYGPQPFIVDLDQATKQNDNYRTALWTGNHLQLTLMSIKVGGDIGVEVHPVIDQFIRIEEGEGIAQMGPTKDNLNYQMRVSDGFAVFVPAGTWHNVVNTGNTPLKVYSIYAPPQHPRGTVHATYEIAHAGQHQD